MLIFVIQIHTIMKVISIILAAGVSVLLSIYIIGRSRTKDVLFEDNISALSTSEEYKLTDCCFWGAFLYLEDPVYECPPATNHYNVISCPPDKILHYYSLCERCLVR